MAKTISDLREEAIVVSGMLQGLDLLMDDTSPAGRNGTASFLIAARERAERLSFGIGDWEDANGRRLAEAGFADITNPLLTKQVTK